ncbi:hypothetical protein SFRURICE_011467 [Spodoptera frugiperda]|nr:hypothetical protein SFRURICE_011467 [Spodoptera frugiperda]
MYTAEQKPYSFTFYKAAVISHEPGKAVVHAIQSAISAKLLPMCTETQRARRPSAANHAVRTPNSDCDNDTSYE